MSEPFHILLPSDRLLKGHTACRPLLMSTGFDMYCKKMTGKHFSSKLAESFWRTCMKVKHKAEISFNCYSVWEDADMQNTEDI